MGYMHVNALEWMEGRLQALYRRTDRWEGWPDRGRDLL